MSGKIKRIGEKPDDGIASEFPWWQADTMNDQKREGCVIGALVAIRRGNLGSPRQHPVRLKWTQIRSSGSQAAPSDNAAPGT